MDDYLRIVKADGESDIRTIEKLARQIWRQHYLPIIGKAQTDYMLEKFQSKSAIYKDIQDGYIYYLAYYNDVPCAYSAIKIERNDIFLSKFYVKSSYRKKGIAKAMLNVIHRPAEQSADRIWLTCNKQNSQTLKVYSRLGFVKTGECKKDIGGGFVMDDFVLEKKLNKEV